MISTADLPLVNAVLNGTAAVLLVAGYAQIRAGRRDRHRALMIAAFVVSALFLVSYVVYHAQAGSRPYQGHGPARAFYFLVLLSHIVLAAAVPVLSVLTLARGLRGRYAAHVRIARWTLPIWLYVSVTGVIVYVMLYH